MLGIFRIDEIAQGSESIMAERPDPSEESQQPVSRPEPPPDHPESTGISAVDSLYDALAPSADEMALWRRPPDLA